jgi:hypothetical protein
MVGLAASQARVSALTMIRVAWPFIVVMRVSWRLIWDLRVTAAAPVGKSPGRTDEQRRSDPRYEAGSCIVLTEGWPDTTRVAAFSA